MQYNSMKVDFSKATKEQLEKLKALCVEFNLIPAPVNPNPAPVPPVKKFGEAKLKDGTVIKWEGEQPLTVGASLLVIDPANPEGFLPMPNTPEEGIALEDGTVIKVVDGKITELIPATVTPPAPDMSAQVEQIQKQFNEVTEKFNTVAKEKETLEGELKTVKEEFEGLKKSNEETNAKLKETLEVFAKAMETPASNPVEEPAYIKSGIGSKVGK